MTALPKAEFIRSRDALEALVARLRGESRIAVDTESNSMHAYRGTTCLIQLSTRAEDCLIDPLVIDDISALGEILAAPTIEKVFHAAEFDLICLKRDFDFTVEPVFDTMAAARVCGYGRIGLGNMLEDMFGIRHPKKHQRADWGKRPLSNKLLRYAQMDTHFLLRLRDALYAELQREGRVDEAREYFADVTNFEEKSPDFNPDGFWDLCRPDSLKPQQAAILRELYILRDELARSRDLPPQLLLGNKTLLKIVSLNPRTRQQLFGVAGLSAKLARRFGDEIIEAVAHGAESLDPPAPPAQEPVPQRVADRYSRLHDWRKRVAQRRGVESDVILSRGSMWELARRMPQSDADLAQVPGIGPWRRKAYGTDLLSLVSRNGRKPQK